MSACARKRPVGEAATFATCSGLPSATICPPAAPPSGPKSIIQSALWIKLRLCSTTTVLPLFASFCSIARSFLMSSTYGLVVRSGWPKAEGLGLFLDPESREIE
jgi:hypothetical protein